jgi:hypothetical protein
VTALVIVPHDHRGADTPNTRRYRTAADIVKALAAARDNGEPESAIIVSDAIAPGDFDIVAEAVRAWPGRCVEVRSAAWDGRTLSPLSAACRGVISGFGEAGLQRALELP